MILTFENVIENIEALNCISDVDVIDTENTKEIYLTIYTITDDAINIIGDLEDDADETEIINDYTITYTFSDDDGFKVILILK